MSGEKLIIHLPGPTPDQVEYVRKLAAASVTDPDDPRLDARVGPAAKPTYAELEALNAQLRERVAELEARPTTGDCPWDAMDDERSNIPETEPCPVCGMLGTPGAEDKCVGGPRRLARPAPVPTAGEEG